jgi:hypothetical protein
VVGESGDFVGDRDCSGNGAHDQLNRFFSLTSGGKLHRHAFPFSRKRHSTSDQDVCLFGGGHHASRKIEGVHSRRGGQLCAAQCLHSKEVHQRLACGCSGKGSKEIEESQYMTHRLFSNGSGAHSPFRLSSAVRANVSVAVCSLPSASHSLFQSAHLS